jgi:hypothetical protein
MRPDAVEEPLCLEPVSEIAVDGLDLTGDDEAVPSRRDPSAAPRRDRRSRSSLITDLAIRPGVDALHVLLGELAQLLGLQGLTSTDGVEVGLTPLVGDLRVARLFGGGGRPHRLGEVVEE